MDQTGLHLLQRIQQGDERAFAELYDQYGGALYGVVIQVVGDEATAQDVLQEGFSKIWRNAGRYEAKKGSPYTWMLNVCRNAAIDKVRSVGFRQQQQNRSLDSDVFDSRAFSEEFNPNVIGLRELVKRLPAKYRKMIEFAYFRGYTHKEIEAELNLPLGTIKSRLRIAIRELRKLTDDHNLR